MAIAMRRWRDGHNRWLVLQHPDGSCRIFRVKVLFTSKSPRNRTREPINDTNPSKTAGQSKWTGIALVVTAAVLWSLSGFFTQVPQLDVWPKQFRSCNRILARCLCARVAPPARATSELELADDSDDDLFRRDEPLVFDGDGIGIARQHDLAHTWPQLVMIARSGSMETARRPAIGGCWDAVRPGFVHPVMEWSQSNPVSEEVLMQPCDGGPRR